MGRKVELISNLDWAGVFMAMSERMRLCESEEQMYRTLQKFKEEFNTEYGRLSRADRNKKGLRWRDGEE